ncbi:MAG: agmatinase [Candidatus Omnitrophica bacterium]|nr:agmatinase [Candidatus Omnitrophota bacterium]
MDNELIDKHFGWSQIKPEYAQYRKSRAVILQCPYDLTASYQKGTRKGPEAILEASGHLEMFDDEMKAETYKIGIYTQTPLKVESMKPEAMIETVKNAVTEVYQAEKFPVLLGGEHSVSIGAVRAAGGIYKDMSVLHCDAHHDLRDEYDGTKYSHACVARRFLEQCPVVQVGTRSLSREEQDFINSNPPGLKIFDVYDILDMALWKENVLRALSEDVYISLDIDVFDPSIMPSTGTPEPGGIGWYELLDCLRMIARTKRIVGFDVVELMPIPGVVSSDFIAAKLVYRLLSYIFFSKDAKRG